MATESLHVPEDALAEVIAVIRAGLETVKASADVRHHLSEWCDEEEEYLNDLLSDDD